jgi:hypothetical protein
MNLITTIVHFDMITMKRSWGCADLCFRPRQWHLLPSLSVSRVGGLTTITIAYLPFSASLFILDRAYRGLFKNTKDVAFREGGDETPETPFGD